jgi:hypothetical protein
MSGSAVHANKALSLLGYDATDLETQILGSVQAAWNAVIPSVQDNRSRTKPTSRTDDPYYSGAIRFPRSWISFYV